MTSQQKANNITKYMFFRPKFSIVQWKSSSHVLCLFVPTLTWLGQTGKLLFRTLICVMYNALCEYKGAEGNLFYIL